MWCAYDIIGSNAACFVLFCNSCVEVYFDVAQLFLTSTVHVHPVLVCTNLPKVRCTYFLNDIQFIVPVLMIVSQHICRTAKRNSIFNVVQCRKEDLETVFREMDLLEIFKTFVKSH